MVTSRSSADMYGQLTAPLPGNGHMEHTAISMDSFTILSVVSATRQSSAPLSMSAIFTSILW